MRYVVCIAAILAVLIGGCGNITKGKEAAEGQVVVFHQQFNNQDFNSITASAEPDMLSITPKPKVVDLFAAVYRKLGKVTSSQMTNWNLRTFNGETRVVLLENSKFEKGNATEQFVFRMRDGKAHLLSYNINSPDLIMK